MSYLEIYNNTGFDLLQESEEEERSLHDLPKVIPFMNQNGLVLKNLSVRAAKDEEELLNILFIGDTNRVVC